MKETLHRYLRDGRDVMLWKLDGLGEYDIRRPLTPTGTNLLGLVKHLAGCEIDYFGFTFGRPFADLPPWYHDETTPNVDMWATAEESREDIVGLYRRACAHSDATIEALALDSVGRVPHWPAERAEIPLHHALVHMTAETHRHAGHADIVRELVDGAAGLVARNDNLPPGDAAWWTDYRAGLERVAAGVRDGSSR
ncbi:DinB family protein [Actinophytocola gossypii]|uniref:DinB family protein n=1 Tax=Actinophytocola gossypii TaxID=2812003 RepID=A0ABT2JE61_9PSEU|nr:DinB family protein [Actinophytocola gossypii]MCT2586145.1 DinB family protein [Actinophytocola gossypii]